jgi:hypothetical protein
MMRLFWSRKKRELFKIRWGESMRPYKMNLEFGMYAETPEDFHELILNCLESQQSGRAFVYRCSIENDPCRPVMQKAHEYEELKIGDLVEIVGPSRWDDDSKTTPDENAKRISTIEKQLDNLPERNEITDMWECIEAVEKRLGVLEGERSTYLDAIRKKDRDEYKRAYGRS